MLGTPAAVKDLKRRANASPRAAKAFSRALALVITASGCSESAADSNGVKPDAAVEGGAPGAPPLSTCGRWMVDGSGRRVKLAGVNWYGASDAELVVGGLDVGSLDHVVQTIGELGFNTVRLPFAHVMLHATDPVEPAHIAANPEVGVCE